MALRMLRTFGFVGYDLFLSTRPEKYVGSEEDWDQAIQALKKALEKQGLSFQIDEGEGVFYGPKIDMKIKDALGRSWQCTTIQLDFNLAERFDLSYTGEDGQPHRPFLIHRAILGSLERFFGILIEHYKGNFPLWLAPVQMSILPIADRHNEYADQLNQLFRREGIRSVVNSRREKIGHKIREAEMAKVPVILIIGDRELQKETVSLRVHTVGDKGEWPVSKLLEKIKILIKNKAITYDF